MRGIAAGTNSETKPGPTGVISGCELIAKSYASPGDGVFQLITVNSGGNSLPPNQNTNLSTLYHDPGFGSSDAVFVENNSFYQNAQGDATIESYYGGKVVVRHNVGTNFMLGIHGNDSSIRSGHIIEVYNNVFHSNLGASHWGTVLSRGGSGVVWGNTITDPSTDIPNNIVLVSYRSAGRLPQSQPDFSLRFPYGHGQLDGSNPFDGNRPITNGSGTHNGANNSTGLVDSQKNWVPGYYQGNGGTDSAADNLQTLYVWNRTDGSGGYALANSPTTITVALSGGTDNDFDVGDDYVVTDGYPGLDQNGWTGPTRFYGTYSIQTLNPWYSWGNTFNGDPNALNFGVGYLSASYTNIAQPDSSVMIQENREYYNNTPKPGYTPYTYPHPLLNSSGGGQINQPPVAIASATPATGVAPLNVVFSSSGSFDPEGAGLSYQWTFGDGSTSSAQNASHVYSSQGEYLAQLIVSDGTNAAASSTLVISITATLPRVGETILADSGNVALPFVVNNGTISQAASSSVSSGGRAVYSFFVIAEGSYAVSGSVKAEGFASNSYFINIDAEPTDPLMLWDIPVATGFTDRIVSWRGSGSDGSPQFVQKMFLLTPGIHQLIIRGAEAGTQLRSITISPEVSTVRGGRIEPQ